MLIVHLFVRYLCHFFSGVGAWLWLLLVALPGLFCLFFFTCVLYHDIPLLAQKLLAQKQGYFRAISP